MSDARDSAARDAELPVPPSLLAAFERRVSSDPDATFVSTLDDGQWSYSEVADRVDELAAVIASAPYSPVIGAYGGNEPASLISLLAAWQSGRCLACCGRQVPADAVRPLFELSGCAAVLASDPGPFDGGPWQTLTVSAQKPAQPRPRRTGEPVELSENACVCFTSGTTGKPKAIMMTNRHILEQVIRITAVPGRPGGFRPRVSAGRPVISFSPFGHNGFHSWLGLALWTGRGLVLVDKFSVEATAAVVSRFSPATLALTPTMIQMLATAPTDLALPGVQYVSSSTAPLAPDVKELFSTRFGIPILQAYGMTELGNVAKEHLEDVTAGRQPRGSVGRVSPGREVRIADADGVEVNRGDEGRVLVRATGQAPTPDAVVVGAGGWFDTGDRGSLDSDGILIISGRTSDRIIVGGFNVTPAEVETEIRSSGLALDAVVVGLPDPRLGERPVAGVVWKGDPQPAELVSVLRDKLAHYKVPRDFFTLDEIPRTPYAKIDRKQAAALARAQLSENIGAADDRH